MYLHSTLMARAAENRPVRVALIGAGKFGSMFLNQVPTTPGLEITVIADLRPDAARVACRTVGWSAERIAATDFTDDAGAAIARNDVDVVIEAPTDYTAACFAQYGMNTDASGRYSAMYKPFHLIGLELGISVLSAARLGQPTGSTRAFTGDVVATAKRDLKAGERLDGEGGGTVWGKLMPASASLATGALPIGLAQDVALGRDIAMGAVVRWDDVTIDETGNAAQIRREMERRFAAP